MSSPFIVHHLLAESAGPLSKVLATQIRLSDDMFHELLHRGSIWANFQRVLNDLDVMIGQYLRVHMEPRRFPTHLINWDSTILHQTEDYLIINKPAGIPVHATVDNRVENVIFALSEHLGAPLYVTQRLDTGTEGVLVLAKTKGFQSRFNKLLRERLVKKTYQALVETPVPIGFHRHYMKDSPHAPKEVSIDAQEGWINCDLIVENVVPREDGLYLVDIELLTGRTHQIRAQMAALGAPLVGDTLYGSRLENPWKPQSYDAKDSFALRAYKVRFPFPRHDDFVDFSACQSPSPGRIISS